MKFLPFLGELFASFQHGVSLVLSSNLVDVTGCAQSVFEEVGDPCELLFLKVFDNLAFWHEDHMLQLGHRILDDKHLLLYLAVLDVASSITAVLVYHFLFQRGFLFIYLFLQGHYSTHYCLKLRIHRHLSI